MQAPHLQQIDSGLAAPPLSSHIIFDTRDMNTVGGRRGNTVEKCERLAREYGGKHAGIFPELLNLMPRYLKPNYRMKMDNVAIIS